MASISRARSVSATAMISRSEATPLEHGGDLAAARRLFPDAPQPFIDLSTGINPHPYPLPPLAANVFTRLPDSAAQVRLREIAARTYGAPSATHVVCAPGTQILLPLLAAIVPPGRAGVLGPTYSEHARAAALAGHAVMDVRDISELRAVDLAVVVNPNNPDGCIITKERLLALSHDLSARGGVLAVDEAFMDVGPPGASLAGEIDRGNIIVLRSFGKFFGLPGLRLGFALAAPDLAAKLDATLGPWRYPVLLSPSPNGPLQIMLGSTPLASDWRAPRKSSTACWPRQTSRFSAAQRCSGWFAPAAPMRYFSILEPPE